MFIGARSASCVRTAVDNEMAYGGLANAGPGGLREESPITLSSQQTMELKQVIRRVEYYQPLYGLRIDPKPLRGCRDRAEAIRAAVGPLGPELRLVDFGSALGYFVFYFADRGVQAEGVESGENNVAVAETVRRINGLPCSFRCAELSVEYVRGLSAGRYDVGMILSVLHHITHLRGLAYVQELLGELLERVPVLILELAHRDEDVRYAWRESLPEDPLAVLAACRNVRTEKLGEFETHLSAVRRGLWRVDRAA
jgi:O-antigen chain-terminating methyltransferase